MRYPNNNCGECPTWLAIDEPEGIPKKEAIEKYCSKCEYDNDCDGRCLNCGYFDHARGCTVEEEI